MVCSADGPLTDRRCTWCKVLCEGKCDGCASAAHTLRDHEEKREADGEGFEPPVGFPTSVFKTGALNRSAIHPFSRFQRIPWSNYQSSNGLEGF